MGLLDIKPNVIDPSLDNKIFLFYGEAGTRKTTVGASFPKHILAATERGYKFINGAMAQDITKWGDMLSFYRELKDDEVRAKFSTVVIDRADTLYSYCYDFVLASLGIKDPGDKAYGGGWSKIKSEFTKVIKGIESLGYGIVFICHDKDILDKQQNYVGTKAELSAQAMSVIRGLADFIFNVRKDTDDNGQRTVYAYSDLEGVETKSRARYFTNRFEFTYENLEIEMKKAIDRQVKIEGIRTERQAANKSEKRSFEELKQSVIDKLTQMQTEGNPNFADVVEMATIQTHGQRISELTDLYYEQLLTIETYIYSLQI